MTPEPTRDPTDADESEMPTPLSPRGIARRADILAIAQSAARRRALRRRARTAAPLALVLLALAALAGLLDQPDPANPPEPTTIARTPAGGADPAPIAPANTPDPSSDRVVQRVTLEGPGAIVRVDAPAPSTIRRIGDDELLAELRGVGMPSGLVRTEGMARVIPLEPRAATAPGSSPGALPKPDGPAGSLRIDPCEPGSV